MKQQFIKDKISTIRMTVFDNNVAIIPSSAVVTLYKTDGTGILQAQASATVNGTTGELTYNITATHTASLGVNYKAAWEYVVGGTTYYENQLFDVVLSILSIPINDDDLYKELPSLRNSNAQESGTATSATSTTLVDTVRRKEVDNYWKGGTVKIISGTGLNQTRNVTASVQSTSTLTVTPAFATTPDATSVYIVIKSWASVINQCFEKINQMIYDKGNRPALIMESSQIRIPLIYLTLATICLDLRDKVDDKWDMTYKEYKDMFENSFNSLKLDYDADESGGVQGEEVQQSINSLNVYRA